MSPKAHVSETVSSATVLGSGAYKEAIQLWGSRPNEGSALSQE